MTALVFQNPAALHGLWLLPVLALLFARSAAERRAAARLFGASAAIVGRKREAWGTCAAFGLAVLALARPAWDLEEHQLGQSGRDVIFLLDVSRSMLADDLHPNRLENAKTAIHDCVDGLDGDRVALVLFAGSAEIRCPLTVDYAYFRMALRQAAPESVGAGGTMLAHALERAAEKLVDSTRGGLTDLILVSDGEDQIEGLDEVAAVERLNEAGVRLVAIGLGDRVRGGRVALEDAETGARTFLRDGQREVWTKLESETLRRMAAAAEDGVYFEVGTGPFDLARIYRQVMENAPRTTTNSMVVKRYRERFPLFLGGAVAALLLANRWRSKK